MEYEGGWQGFYRVSWGLDEDRCEQNDLGNKDMADMVDCGGMDKGEEKYWGRFFC